MQLKTLLLFILVSTTLFSQEIIEFNDEEIQYCLTKECGANGCEITKIEIVQDGRLSQIIEPGENAFHKTFPNDQLFKIEDMNFDGKKDFRLLEFLPASANIPYLYFIYNPGNERFEKNPKYAEITAPTFDHNKEQINSSWRDGCCRYGRDIYVIKKGSPELEERFVKGQKSNGKEYSEHWKIKNGELKLDEKNIE